MLASEKDNAPRDARNVFVFVGVCPSVAPQCVSHVAAVIVVRRHAIAI